MSTAPPSTGALPDAASKAAVSRYLGLVAALLTGFAAVLAGLLSDTPAPTTLWRAVAVGAAARLVVGGLARLVVQSLGREKPKSPVAEEAVR